MPGTEHEAQFTLATNSAPIGNTLLDDFEVDALSLGDVVWIARVAKNFTFKEGMTADMYVAATGDRYRGTLLWVAGMPGGKSALGLRIDARTGGR